MIAWCQLTGLLFAAVAAISSVAVGRHSHGGCHKDANQGTCLDCRCDRSTSTMEWHGASCAAVSIFLLARALCLRCSG